MEIFFDESIHARGNFIVLAAVCATQKDIESAHAALIDFGFRPGFDEFKSSMKMKGDERAQGLRDRFQ
jgi:hypothetical protein